MKHITKLSPSSLALAVAMASFILTLTACGGGGGGGGSDPPTNDSSSPLEGLQVETTFNYETTRDVLISVLVVDANGNPQPGIVVSFFTEDNHRVGAGRTGQSGYHDQLLSLPTYLDKVVVHASIIGRPAEKTIEITDSIEVTLGSHGGTA